MSNQVDGSDLEIDAETAQVTEASLVRLAQAGDTGAFGELVRVYHRRAISIAYRLLNNAEDAKDVSQDAFVRAFRSLSQLDDPERFGAWLLRIVSNLSLNYRRARKGRAAIPIEELSPYGGEPADTLGRSGQPQDNAPALPGELETAIEEAMNQLPDQQRLALVLFSVEGLPQKEVADVLECSVEMVKWNVFQARKSMKVMLADFL
ncbi:MAG: sigma-70 family RNA polymerase sigma factor [Planctomycetes bacterium]|nr:sigma-70 family RNA polymerase sigma factor [Planctomycetota bacterium]MCH8967080.1 sigma-70 family RNA polymerase sigma factor [Planctomycetota bacterium]